MPSRSATVLASVLQVFRPMARLLLRHGVAYPAFAAALKQVFLEAARDELRRTGHKETDSAVSLLSGVHRRDVRTLGRMAPIPRDADAPLNLASQVVGRWLSDVEYLDEEGQPRPLPRFGAAPSFDALVAEVSRDIRAKAILEELERLSIVSRDPAGRVQLAAHGFAPREGFDEQMALLRDNLHDHAAAAMFNVSGEHDFLEQSIFVDQLTAASAHRLHAVAAKAWRQAFRTVMREAQERFAEDQAGAAPPDRTHRARFGAFYYAEEDHAPDP